MAYSDEHVVAFERGGDGAIRGITMGEAESFASRPGFKVLAALPERHRHVAHQGGISGCIVLSQKLEADEPWHVLHLARVPEGLLQMRGVGRWALQAIHHCIHSGKVSFQATWRRAPSAGPFGMLPPRMDCNLPGNHQFHSPSTRMVAGPSRQRISVASSRIA